MNLFRKIKSIVKHFIDVALDENYKNVHPTSYVAHDVNVTVPDNLILEEHCSLGPGAKILNLRAKFIMKKYSFSGPDLMVVTGNHMAVIGIPMKFVDDKMKDQLDVENVYDKDVVVDEDVWLGGRVTLLSGVHIGRGCLVCAGAVVTKDMPPYSVVGGVPAKVIKFRWKINEILEHERMVYPLEEQFSIEYLTKTIK